MTTSFGDHPHTALLKIPSGEPNGSKHEIPCTFQGMDGKQLRLEAPERIVLSAPVSVEYSDAMFLGEVVSCQRGTGGVWELNIKVDQILTGSNTNEPVDADRPQLPDSRSRPQWQHFRDRRKTGAAASGAIRSSRQCLPI